MKAFELVALLDGIERRIDELTLEDGLAGHMVARRPVDADAGQVDRGGLRHARKAVGEPHEVRGINIRCAGRVDPGSALPVQRAKLVALKEYDGAAAFTADIRHVIPNAEVVPVCADPNR